MNLKKLALDKGKVKGRTGQHLIEWVKGLRNHIFPY